MPTPHSLSRDQERVLAGWFPSYEVVADHSWGLVDTVVLQVRHENQDLIVKAGGTGNHHISREIAARRDWTRPWLETRSVGALLHASTKASMLAMEHLPGLLVQDLPEAAGSPDTYRQAGRLLSAFHTQAATDHDEYEAAADAKALRWLTHDHRIPPATEARLRAVIASHDHDVAELVPTHGDWHTRNWLIDGDTVTVIDLGRADWRPAITDFARLARREWAGRPDLEDAFLEGYGNDPRRPGPWRATLLREAVGTAVWAYQVGDLAFEEQGHRMIAQALELYV